MENLSRQREKPPDCKSENTFTIMVELQMITSNKLEGMPNISSTQDEIQIRAEKWVRSNRVCVRVELKRIENLST